MKLSIAILSLFAVTGPVWSHQLPLIPETTRLDIEVSSNVAFNAERSDTRSFGVSMAFMGVASNCIQVVFGHDADGVRTNFR